MKPFPKLLLTGLLLSTASPFSAWGQSSTHEILEHVGEMHADLPFLGDDRDEEASNRDPLQFEPLQMYDDLFRDDIVLLMRHGPTDWSKRDRVGVAPTDCENQRVLSPEGRDRMQGMGILLSANRLTPSRIIVSQWCRNQQTLEALLKGMALIDPNRSRMISVQTDPSANLLCPSVEAALLGSGIVCYAA